MSLMPPLMASYLGDVLQGSSACLGLVFSAPHCYQSLTCDSNKYRPMEAEIMQSHTRGRGKCSRKPTQEGLIYNLSASMQCRQVALKMISTGRVGRNAHSAISHHGQLE